MISAHFSSRFPRDYYRSVTDASARFPLSPFASSSFLPSCLEMAEGNTGSADSSETHPLEHEWVLWEHAGGANKDPNKWKENMKPLCEVKTIENFWQYFNHIPRPSEVFFDGDSRKKLGPEGKTVEEYSLFKKGIEPEWGDPRNVTGGEWYCRQYLEPEILDLYWLNLVMGVVGETIESEENSVHINGARVVDKGRSYAMFRLELWIDTRDPEIKERIRTRMVDIMTDGQPPMRKTHPKFDWKDHNA